MKVIINFILIIIACNIFSGESFAYILLAPPGKSELGISLRDCENDFMLIPEIGWVGNNGELLTYKDKVILLSGYNNIGKTTFSCIAAIEYPDWRIVSSAVALVSLAKEISSDKIFLVGRQKVPNINVINSRMLGHVDYDIAVSDKMFPLDYIIMFDQYFDFVCNEIASKKNLGLSIDDFCVNLINVKFTLKTRAQYERIIMIIENIINSQIQSGNDVKRTENILSQDVEADNCYLQGSL
ncbi:MAG: hypothetical protein ABII27_07340 [bacterium]